MRREAQAWHAPGPKQPEEMAYQQICCTVILMHDASGHDFKRLAWPKPSAS